MIYFIFKLLFLPIFSGSLQFCFHFHTLNSVYLMLCCLNVCHFFFVVLCFVFVILRVYACPRPVLLCICFLSPSFLFVSSSSMSYPALCPVLSFPCSFVS